MDWRTVEKWVTIAFGLAAALALAISSIKTWAPQGSWLRRLAPDEVVSFLAETGDISGGLIVIVFLLLLGGNRIMTVLLRGIEKLSEMREERKRIRTEAREEGLAEGRAEGRTEGREEGLTEGRTQGLAEGREEGRTQGLAEGQEEGRAQTNQEWQAWAKQLIKEGKLPPDVEFPAKPDDTDDNQE